MRVVYRGTYRGTTGRVRSGLSFGVSGCLHGCVLAWVILGGAGPPPERAQSIYDREIRPYEKRIVWYSLQEKLPEIAPAGTRGDARLARARMKAPQTMVAGARDDARPGPLIWAPEPEVAAPKERPLPNVVAVTPKVVRPFVAPPVKAPAGTPAVLPDAPRVAADVKAALLLPALTPKVVRPFLAPTQRSLTVAAPIELPDAPRVAEDVKQRSESQGGTPVAALIATVAPSGPRRAFAPPNVRMQRQAMPPLPEGPQPEMVVVPNALPFPGAGPRPQARAFTVPPAKPRSVMAVGLLPEAPSVSAVRATSRPGPQAGTPVAALIGRLPAMPPVPGAMGGASLAIVGLNPARTTEVPAPPASRAAGFSAGPERRAEGSTGAIRSALVNVPGLVVSGGAKNTRPTLVATFSPTSRENLLAAARVSKGLAPKVPVERGALRAAVPDARFAGRVVYTVAIQMPNVTSFSGSWLVWFAERVPDPEGTRGAAPREMRPPEVVRKVDPKYVAAAVAERVEGTVRLFGVIGKDGHVGGIALLRQLDERLDRSAREALAKWEFTPALRDGVAVDVDAIFEIPFHLAPRPKL